MSESVSLNAVLFDMDGVLVDVSQSYRRAIAETVMHFTGREIPDSTIQRYKNVGGFNDDWKLTYNIITDSGMNVPYPRVVEEFQKRYRGEDWNGFIAEEPPLVDKELLETICDRVRIMGIVTSRPEAEAKWTLERFGWKKFFPLVVAREKQEGRGKPNPFPLQHALAILDAAGLSIEADEAVYVGDSVDDMECARAASLWAVGMVPPYLDTEEHAALLRERGAHLVLDDPADLVEVIDSFSQRLAVEANG